MQNGSSNPILPPQTIGIVGGGQLGQMMALSAKAMGYKVIVLDPTPASPTGQVSDEQIVAEYDDDAAILELARKSDVLTYEFENVDVGTLQEAQQYTQLPQGTKLLEVTRNRLSEKTFLADHGVPVTPFKPIHSLDDLKDGIKAFGYGSILKTVSGGYDGHGQLDINSDADFTPAIDMLDHAECILEKRQSFSKELSVMVVRTASGEIQVFPTVENIHHDHILHETIVPARVSPATAQRADEIAKVIAQEFELRGVLGIEFFMLADGTLMVNELAPRPHNSGHYSIEACNVSQFEAHVRSICGLPIPAIELISPAVMVNLLGQHLPAARERLVSQTNWHFHDYGKAEIKHNRKMGHITILGPDVEQLIAQIEAEKFWEVE